MEFRLELEAIMESAQLLDEERNVLVDLASKDFLACRGYIEHLNNPMYMQTILHLEEKGLKERFIDAMNRSLNGYSDDPMLEEGIANEY